MNEDVEIRIWLAEYDKLKAEQTQRIGFRDNLLYVTLSIFGAIVSFAVSNESNYYAFLVIPWACLILGWTYLINDEKISAIGRYVRLTLSKQLSDKDSRLDEKKLFGWEVFHRSDHRRSRRKVEQLIIDEITFVVSGITALVVFWSLVSEPSTFISILSITELLLLIFLACEIVDYADLAKGK